MKKSIGFIGGGRITKIFLQAFANKDVSFSSIVVCDSNIDVLNALKATFPQISISDSPLLPAKQDIVFIALHPPVIMETLELIKNEISVDSIVISLAPKISIKKMAEKLNRTFLIVRLIPNATSYINEGYNPVCFAEGFSDFKKVNLLEILRNLGYTFEVPEQKLEGYAILSAMLPTYFWFQMKELIMIGGQIGLTEDESINSVRDTLSAALKTYFYSGLQPDKVIDLIPIKPIGEHEQQIIEFYESKLLPLFDKIKP